MCNRTFCRNHFVSVVFISILSFYLALDAFVDDPFRTLCLYDPQNVSVKEINESIRNLILKYDPEKTKIDPSEYWYKIHTARIMIYSDEQYDFWYNRRMNANVIHKISIFSTDLMHYIWCGDPILGFGINRFKLVYWSWWFSLAMIYVFTHSLIK